jgi:hypothetical protein
MPYYHVVFTLPAPIADIAYHNKAAIYGILFKSAAETLITIAADPKHLGAEIGLTAVLHSWGSARANGEVAPKAVVPRTAIEPRRRRLSINLGHRHLMIG